MRLRFPRKRHPRALGLELHSFLLRGFLRLWLVVAVGWRDSACRRSFSSFSVKKRHPRLRAHGVSKLVMMFVVEDREDTFNASWLCCKASLVGLFVF
jgi:hypothetical protein